MCIYIYINIDISLSIYLYHTYMYTYSYIVQWAVLVSLWGASRGKDSRRDSRASWGVSSHRKHILTRVGDRPTATILYAQIHAVDFCLGF